MLLFVPPDCRCHDVGRFRFTVIGYGLELVVTSRFLWTAPYTNEILDVDTSKCDARLCSFKTCNLWAVGGNYHYSASVIICSSTEEHACGCIN